MEQLLGKVQDNSKKIDGKIKMIKWMLKKYWYLHILALIVSVGIAKYINFKVVPMYTSKGSFLIYDKDAGHKGGAEVASLTDALNRSTSISDEIAIITSPSLFYRLVEKLNLHINMYDVQKYKNVELYNNRPFSVTNFFDSSADGHAYSVQLKIISNDQVQIGEDKKKVNYKLGVRIPISSTLSIVINKSKDFHKFIGRTIYYSEAEKYDAAVNYAAALNVQRLDKSSNVITVSEKDPFAKRAFDITNGVMNEYMAMDVENKRASADTAYQYVLERLDTIADELNRSEAAIAAYRHQHGLLNAATQSNMVLSDKNENEKALRDREMQSMLINDYKNFISEHLYSIAPFIPNVENHSTLATNIVTYNELLKERAKTLLVYNESNPVIVQLDKNLAELRQQLLFGLTCVNKEFAAKTLSLDKTTSSINSTISDIPEIEKGYIQLARKQSIMQEMYLYLQKAKAEIAMSKEKEISSVKIITSPTIGKYGDVGAPRKTLMMCILIGLMVPSAFIYYRHLLSDKISSFGDLASRTKVPLLGVVNHISGKSSKQKTEKYTTGEQFRFLRSNILQRPENKCILVTSTLAGEGKSFISINVAKSLSLLGKKVVLLELDLRKPGISKIMGLDGNCGIAEYVGQEVAYHDILKETSFSDNLHIITAGKVCGHPSEVLLNCHIKCLVSKLKEDYDYVILDSPPVGVVSDGYTLSQYADITLFIVRFNYSIKDNINFLNDVVMLNKLPNVAVVANDIDSAKLYYSYEGSSSYDYRYGGKEAYGHTGNKKEKSKGQIFKKSIVADMFC